MTQGIAVTIGMLFVLQLSEKKYNKDFSKSKLLQWMKTNHYPTTLPKIDSERLMDKMKSDKKVINDNIPMILLSEIGQAVTIEFSFEELSKELEYFLEKGCQKRIEETEEKQKLK